MPGTKWAHIPEGTIIKAKKGIYGLNDAPLRWFTEHKDTILKLEGAERSKLNPALFLFRDDQGTVVGMIAVHVDDDLIAGNEEFFENQVAKLKKLHCYGKWQTASVGFMHCGRFLQQQPDGIVTCGQRDYADSIEKIPLEAARRADKEAKATKEEREALRSGNGKISWLVRSSRMDLTFRLVESQTRAVDDDLGSARLQPDRRGRAEG